jgi:surface polysaccharide O-acyltransferase-like enzyme
VTEQRRNISQVIGGRLPSVDAFKLFAAFAVVYIHISGTDFGVGSFGQSPLALALNIFTKLAVPFFFVVSGYFIFRTVQTSNATKIVGSVAKLVSLLILSLLLYTLFKLVFQQDIIISPQTVISAILFNVTDFIGPHLWFLAALIYVYTFYYLIVKLRFNDKLIAIIAISLFVVGLCIHTYSALTGFSFPSSRNFMFFGIPFFTLGYFLAKYSDNISLIATSKLIKFFLVSLFLYIIEYLALSSGSFSSLGTKEYDYYIFLPVLVASVFMLLLKFPEWLSTTPVPKLGRDYSLHIYIVHIIVLTVLYEVITNQAIKIDSPVKVLLVAVVCSVISLLLAMIYTSMKQRLSNFWSNLVYSLKLLFARYWIALVAGIIGVVVFGLLFGFAIVNPTNDAWILGLSGDISQHYIGWLYFRDAPWQLPFIGHITTLPVPSGTSIVFLDSIPLFALFFKFIGGYLPETFQYLGLFTLMSFTLQGLISALILSRFTKNKTIILLGATILILSPILLSRSFAHTALTAHWVILLAILLLVIFYQKKVSLKIQIIAWSITIALATLIHPYFIPMIIAVLALSTINQHTVFKKSALLFGIPLITAGFIFFLLGGLSGSTSGGGSGLGLYSLNLLSLVTPLGYSSFFSVNFGNIQWEGLAYLGLGVLLLIPIIGTLYLQKLNSVTPKKLKKNFALLFKGKRLLYILVCIAVLIFSLSPIIKIGDWTLIQLPLPTIFEKVWSIFRSTGRIFWPLYYLLVVGILIYIIRNPLKLKLPILIGFLTFFTLLQVVDVVRSPAALEKRTKVEAAQLETTSDSLNTKFISDYCSKNEVVVLDDNLEVGAELFHELPDFIVKCKPLLNNGYFARPPASDIINYARAQQDYLLKNNSVLKKDTLYITRSKEIAEKIRDTDRYDLNKLDAYWVINQKNYL